MSAAVMPPKVAAFVEDLMPSATHRRMLHVGMVLTKVGGMFQLTSDEVPEQAKLAFIAFLEGLESGDADEYARCEAIASNLYRDWLAKRAVN